MTFFERCAGPKGHTNITPGEERGARRNPGLELPPTQRPEGATAGEVALHPMITIKRFRNDFGSVVAPSGRWSLGGRLTPRSLALRASVTGGYECVARANRKGATDIFTRLL